MVSVLVRTVLFAKVVKEVPEEILNPPNVLAIQRTAIAASGVYGFARTCKITKVSSQHRTVPPSPQVVIINRRFEPIGAIRAAVVWIRTLATVQAFLPNRAVLYSATISHTLYALYQLFPSRIGNYSE
jgi:hypothetical protein